MPRNLSFAEETVHFGNASQGTAQFKTQDGKATFTAHLQNGKVARLTATGPDGQPLKVFTLRETAAQEGDGGGSGSGSGPVECWVCITAPGGTQFCYRIDCKNVPAPIPDPKFA